MRLEKLIWKGTHVADFEFLGAEMFEIWGKVRPRGNAFQEMLEAADVPPGIVVELVDVVNGQADALYWGAFDPEDAELTLKRPMGKAKDRVLAQIRRERRGGSEREE